MKHDYEKYQGDALHALYYREFGSFFGVNINDHSDHRQEVIDCIESGTLQDMSRVRGGWTVEDGIPGVDFVL